MPRKATMGGAGGALGQSLINDRFKLTHHKLPANYGEKDCPKNAHLVPDWEDLDEARKEAYIEATTSVVDEKDMAAMMRMATLAGNDFASQRQSVKVVTGPTTVDLNARAKIPEKLKKLPIPKRPYWDKKMSKETVDKNEKEAFYEWRRGLAEIEENFDVELTPFEKNLEFWRQLWRVVEKSDVLVQVVDARNPLIYRSEALEEYVKEVAPWKGNVLLFNKADLLPTEVRLAWARYLDTLGVRYFFFAARSEIERRVREERDAIIPEQEEWNGNYGAENGIDDDVEETSASSGNDDRPEGMTEAEVNSTEILNAERLFKELETMGEKCADIGRPDRFGGSGSDTDTLSMTSSRLQREYTMIGFVGYPNVGKSSTINALLGQKKVGVTSTPGKTKHFQTMIVTQDTMLCDCPGLVFPSVVSSRAEMVCGGILPLNILKDHIQPMELLCRRIPRSIFEEAYNIVLPSKTSLGIERVYVTWEELCQGYAVARGMLTGQAGVPDTHTAARKILKDYVYGKLRFCHMPPGQTDLALGPLKSDQAEDEGSVAKTEVKQAGGMGNANAQEAGVAAATVKKNRKGRENRGLSAGAWVEDEERSLMQTNQGTGVSVAKGGKKHKQKNFVRVERPYSAVPVRGANAVGVAQAGRPVSAGRA